MKRSIIMGDLINYANRIHLTMVSMSDSMLVMPSWSFCWSVLFSRMFFMMKMTFSISRVFASVTMACGDVGDVNNFVNLIN